MTTAIPAGETDSTAELVGRTFLDRAYICKRSGNSIPNYLTRNALLCSAQEQRRERCASPGRWCIRAVVSDPSRHLIRHRAPLRPLALAVSFPFPSGLSPSSSICFPQPKSTRRHQQPNLSFFPPSLPHAFLPSSSPLLSSSSPPPPSPRSRTEPLLLQSARLSCVVASSFLFRLVSPAILYSTAMPMLL